MNIAAGMENKIEVCKERTKENYRKGEECCQIINNSQPAKII